MATLNNVGTSPIPTATSSDKEKNPGHLDTEVLLVFNKPQMAPTLAFRILLKRIFHILSNAHLVLLFPVDSPSKLKTLRIVWEQRPKGNPTTWRPWRSCWKRKHSSETGDENGTNELVFPSNRAQANNNLPCTIPHCRIRAPSLNLCVCRYRNRSLARSRRLLPPPKLPLQTLKSQVPNQSRSPKLRSENQKSGQQRVYPNGQDWKIEVPILFPQMWLKSGDLKFSFIYFLMRV